MEISTLIVLIIIISVLITEWMITIIEVIITIIMAVIIITCRRNCMGKKESLTLTRNWSGIYYMEIFVEGHNCS